MKMVTGWTKPAILAAALLLAGLTATLAVSWPGHLSYDSILQLQQGRSGLYNNWHPPVMAWLLGLGDAVIPGAGLFVAFDCILLFGALLALIAIKPDRTGVPALAAILLVLLSPQVLLYQGLVWKDVLFADALVAGFVALAVSAAAWTSPRPRAIWLTAAGVLLLLAALTRQNGAVVLPIAAAALAWIAVRQGATRIKAMALGVACLAILAAAGIGARGLLDLRGDGADGPGEQIRLLQLYDLAGAVARAPALPLDTLGDDDPKLVQLIRAKAARLYTPQRNDPMAEDPDINRALENADPGEIGTQWRTFVAENPWLYLRVRSAAFFWVLATPDIAACRPVFTGIEGPERPMKQLGLLPRRDARDRLLDAYGKMFFGTPVWSHLAYAVLAIGCLVLLLRRRTPADIAMAALLAGALAFTASFFAISIACDYRYLYALDLSALAALVYLALDARGAWRGTA